MTFPPPMHASSLAIGDKTAFVAMLRTEFAIEWRGFHGAAHWARVARNGVLLCEATHANRRVTSLFALLHDLRRENEGRDVGHGARAAAFIPQIADEHLLLDRQELAQLVDACAGHSEGLLSRDPTVAACWDADRLDLGRVGIQPRADLLSLPASRHPELMNWAHRRATAWRYSPRANQRPASGRSTPSAGDR